MRTCPVCGAQVRTLPWRTARYFAYAESAAEQVERIGAHEPGRSEMPNQHSSATRCRGSYEIPKELSR